MGGPSDGREFDKTVNYVGALIEKVVDFFNPANLFGNAPMFPSTATQGIPNSTKGMSPPNQLELILLSNPLTAGLLTGTPAEQTRANPNGNGALLYIGLPIVAGVIVAVWLMRRK